MSAILGPIPPYSNVPINPQWYSPRTLVISGMTLGQTTTVTTINNVEFKIGQQIRLLIPPQFGCVQLNNKTGYVLSIPTPNQVVVSIDSSVRVNQFVSGSGTVQPQIIPIGDINSGNINTGTTQLSVPGSFINISLN